ncbi:MAG: hypothetical protein ABR589_00155 [Chthoniobacterales bacterium]
MTKSQISVPVSTVSIPLINSEGVEPPVRSGGTARLFVRESIPVVLAFLASRLLIYGLILLSRLIVLPSSRSFDGGFLTVLVQREGVSYFDIARTGYGAAAHAAPTLDFFPLYPLLVRGVSLVFRNFAVASVVTANLALFVAGLLLHRLLRKEYTNPKIARAGVWFLMFTPGCLFFSVGYSESTFLALALGSLLAAMNRQWLLASVCGMALAATRSFGVLILFPLAIEFLWSDRQAHRAIDALLRPRNLLLALIPTGLAAVVAFGYAKYHNLLAASEALKIWGPGFRSPVAAFADGHRGAPTFAWLFGGVVVTSTLMLAAGCWLKMRASHIAYALILLAVSLFFSGFEAIPRTICLIFPLYAAAGMLSVRSRWLYEPLLAASVVVLSMLTVLWANGYWIP